MYYKFVDVYIHRLKEGKNMLDILKCTLGGADLSSTDLKVIPALTSTWKSLSYTAHFMANGNCGRGRPKCGTRWCLLTEKKYRGFNI